MRNIAQVDTAVANGDLSQKITVDARGEILELKDTINTMVDQLSSFADEVTRVAREVGTEGKLGGQAEVEGVSGTWRDLTENVNQLAGNLTTQVRAIAEVSTAVTQGDLTRQITVEAQRRGRRAQGQHQPDDRQPARHDAAERRAGLAEDEPRPHLRPDAGPARPRRRVSRLIMSELTPLVDAQHGAFFLDEPSDGDERRAAADRQLRLQGAQDARNRFKLGEGLVGQAALEGKPILLTEAPDDYIKVTSGPRRGRRRSTSSCCRSSSRTR